jgi:hypothetical protein
VGLHPSHHADPYNLPKRMDKEGEELMSDRAAMRRETEEVFAELRGMFDWLSEEQASRVWLGGSGVRESLNRIREHAAQNCEWRAARTRRTAESILTARDYWAPDSYWGRRYPGKREA